MPEMYLTPFGTWDETDNPTFNINAQLAINLCERLPYQTPILFIITPTDNYTINGGANYNPDECINRIKTHLRDDYMYQIKRTDTGIEVKARQN